MHRFFLVHFLELLFYSSDGACLKRTCKNSRGKVISPHSSHPERRCSSICSAKKNLHTPHLRANLKFKNSSSTSGVPPNSRIFCSKYAQSYCSSVRRHFDPLQWSLVIKFPYKYGCLNATCFYFYRFFLSPDRHHRVHLHDGRHRPREVHRSALPAKLQPGNLYCYNSVQAIPKTFCNASGLSQSNLRALPFVV